jgi:hypothetical protein
LSLPASLTNKPAKVMYCGKKNYHRLANIAPAYNSLASN